MYQECSLPDEPSDPLTEPSRLPSPHPERFSIIVGFIIQQYQELSL